MLHVQIGWNAILECIEDEDEDEGGINVVM